MKVSFQGFNEGILTFETLNKLKVGSPVCMQANSGTVMDCLEDETFIGFVVQSEERHAGVQVSGYIRVKYSGAAPVPGYRRLCTNNREGVKVSETNGRTYLVLDVDTKTTTVGLLLA